jgi:acrylyl-CoA reductase (NADPH)
MTNGEDSGRFVILRPENGGIVMDVFRAIVARERGDGIRGQVEELTAEDLPPAGVLVDVAYSTINYKDALAVTGKAKICRTLPLVCGIDLAGTVRESSDRRFHPGDRVLVNGYGLSERHPGGYTQRQRLDPSWLVRVPVDLSLEETMAIGTAGYTAMLCVQALIDHGVLAGSGPVVVTGASGGVGSVAILLLAKLGYEVVAATGRVEASGAWLRDLGAGEIIDRAELAHTPKPLESERWTGAVDSVGGETLATVLAQTRYRGAVTACGLAGGMPFPGNVAPFILRGVTLAGIDSVMASHERRVQAWDRLATLIDRGRLASIYRVEPLHRVPELAAQLLAGEVRGRIVVDVNA